jgi:hypothetical protein
VADEAFRAATYDTDFIRCFFERWRPATPAGSGNENDPAAQA